MPDAPAPVKAAATDAPTPADTPDAPPGNSDSDMARLFVSVGRSRRVSRQMLTDLDEDLARGSLGEGDYHRRRRILEGRLEEMEGEA